MFHVALAQIINASMHAIHQLISDGGRNQGLAGSRYCGYARGQVDTDAIGLEFIDEYVCQMDSDAQLHRSRRTPKNPVARLGAVRRAKRSSR